MQVLHIHSDTVSCAVFQETNQGLLLTKGAHHHYSSDDELQACVQQQVAALFNPQERTIVAIPPQAYGFWNVSIPLMDRSKLIEVLPTEIMRELGKNQPVVVDVIKKADQEYLALWADMSVIQGIIDLLRFTGIDPEVITCPQLCWQHLLPATSTEAITLVDSHALTVFVDHLPLLARVSPQPIDASFIKTSTAVLTFTGQPDVTKVFAIGPSTSEAPPPLPIPDDWYQRDALHDHNPILFLSCYAVACCYRSSDIINLRRGPLRWFGQASRLLGRYHRSLVLLLVLSLSLLLYGSLAWYQSYREISHTNAIIDQIVASSLKSAPKHGEEPQQLQQHIKHLQSFSGSSDMLAFLTILGQYKPSTVQGFSEIDFDGSRCLLRGEATDTEGILQLITHLTKAGWSMQQPEITRRPQQPAIFTLRGSKGGTR